MSKKEEEVGRRVDDEGRSRRGRWADEFESEAGANWKRFGGELEGKGRSGEAG